MNTHEQGLIDPFDPHGQARSPARRSMGTQTEYAAAGSTAPARRADPRQRSTVQAKSLMTTIAGALALLAVGGAAFFWFQNLRASDLIVLNGFDAPLEVRVEGAGETITETVPPRGRRALQVAGAVDVIVTSQSGEAIARESFEVPRDADLVAYNIHGAAAVALEEIVYSLDPMPFGSTPELVSLAGERIIIRDDVDYIFQEPPVQIDMPSNARSVTYWAFNYLYDGSWTSAVNELLAGDTTGRPDSANRQRAHTIVSTMRRLDPDNVAARSFETMLRGGPGTPGALPGGRPTTPPTPPKSR